MYRRFFPSGDDITGDPPTLFAIMDQAAMHAKQYPFQLWQESAGFGLAWKEKEDSRLFTQAFGYKVATISEMEWDPEKDVGGYYFYCFKTPPFAQDTLMLKDETMKPSRDNSDPNKIMVGWGFHSSRYYPYAIREAMYCSYFNCRQEGKKIAKRLDKELVEIMHRDTRWELKHHCSDYTDNKELPIPRLESGPFTPIFMRKMSLTMKEREKKESQ